jgi:pimeloyl-ACP methyl ester carboxylesterase
MAGDYAAIAEPHDIHDALLVGHSMGGFLAMIALLEQPEFAARLNGLVLFATFGGSVLHGAPQNRLQIPLLPILHAFGDEDYYARLSKITVPTVPLRRLGFLGDRRPARRHSVLHAP